MSKLEKEAKAIEDAENALKARKAKLADLVKQEREKKLARLVRKVGLGKATNLLERAVEMGAQNAVERLASE